MIFFIMIKTHAFSEVMDFYGFSRAQLAEILGISPVMIKKVIYGERNLSDKVASRLSELKAGIKSTSTTNKSTKASTSVNPKLPGYYIRAEITKARTRLNAMNKKHSALLAEYQQLNTAITKLSQAAVPVRSTALQLNAWQYHRNINLLNLNEQKTKLERAKLFPLRAALEGVKAEIMYWQKML